MIDHRTEAVAQTALDVFQQAVADLVDRSLTQLPHLAAASTQAVKRQEWMDAEQQLARCRSKLWPAFARAMRESLDKWGRHSAHSPLSESAAPDWSALSLVDDDTVDRSVAADRLAQNVSTRCDTHLATLHAQLSALSGATDTEEAPPHPFRPQVVTKALLDSLAQEGVERPAVQTLIDLWTTLLPDALAPAYEQLVGALRRQGIEPLPPTVRRRASASTTSGMGLQTAPAPLSSSPSSPSSTGGELHSRPMGGGPGGHAGERVAQVLSHMFGVPTPWQDQSHGAHTMPGSATGPAPLAEAAGNADFQDLLRRIAMVNMAAGGASGPVETASLGAGGVDATAAAGFAGPLMAPNMIRTHREELIQARGGAPLDQMIIDIVAALFDQVLSDPKVAPQMARQIARLQMPVLRVALSDSRFFSSRRHPVRRFVNRIANLSAAFDDLDSGAGLECVQRVTNLVSEVVEGDFERMDLYEAKLVELESFIDSMQAADDDDVGAIQSMLMGREADLRVHQRYMQVLHKELADVELPTFVREFLTQIWSQVQVMAASREGPQSALAQRMKEAGRELVLSVQPKGHPQLRKAFLLKLPKLMKDLNEGMGLIQWPEDAKQAFFAQLLPAHAECLKAAPAHDLTQRMLEHRLNKVEQIKIPSRDEAANDPLPAESTDVRSPPTLTVVGAFTPQEAAQAGLVSEAAVAEEAALDINLCDPPGTDPSLAELDIDLDSPPPPAQGLQLVHHIQKGTAYQMMMQGQWKKVRLTWVSEGRTFFIFTHGGMHKKTISLTARTLAKMCDSGRFRAFEQAELIERATVRARRQLAALQTGQRPRDAA